MLGFSHIDWGQDILEVDQWIKKYPDRQPRILDLECLIATAQLFGVQAGPPTFLPRDASIDDLRRSVSETQWWIISVQLLYNKPDSLGLQFLQQVEPVDRIAYAYHVYRVDPLFDETQVVENA